MDSNSQHTIDNKVTFSSSLKFGALLGFITNLLCQFGNYKGDYLALLLGSGAKPTAVRLESLIIFVLFSFIFSLIVYAIRKTGSKEKEHE